MRHVVTSDFIRNTVLLLFIIITAYSIGFNHGAADSYEKGLQRGFETWKVITENTLFPLPTPSPRPKEF